MKITLHVVQTDGHEYTVKTNLFTVVAMERKFKIKASELASGIAVEQLAFLAYESCKQHDIVVPVVFDDYIKLIDSIDVVSEDAPNPSVEAVTHGN